MPSRRAKKHVSEERVELSGSINETAEQRCQKKIRIQNPSDIHVGSRTGSGDHRGNRSCLMMECLPCREAGKVAGKQVAEGRSSRAAGPRWRSFGLREAEQVIDRWRRFRFASELYMQAVHIHEFTGTYSS